MKRANGQYVAKNQKRKNNSSGFLGWHDLCHKNNCEQAKGTETRFGESRRDSSGKGKEPSMRGEIGH